MSKAKGTSLGPCRGIFVELGIKPCEKWEYVTQEFPSPDGPRESSFLPRSHFLAGNVLSFLHRRNFLIHFLSFVRSLFPLIATIDRFHQKSLSFIPDRGEEGRGIQGKDQISSRVRLHHPRAQNHGESSVKHRTIRKRL